MKIEEFYDTKISNISYEAGHAKTIADFYNDFIKPRFPSKDIMEAWHRLIVDYVNSPNAIYFIRKYESSKKKGVWNTRRGCVVHFDNLEVVYSSNFLAHDIYLMAKNNFCPSFDDFKDMVENRKLRNTIGTKFERDYSLYPGNNKILKCYLAHIIAVNQDGYLRNDGKIKKISKTESKKLYPLGEANNWNNIKKMYELNYALEPEEIEILKAHTIRLLDPINYFLTPQTNNCSHTIKGFNKNIGEYKGVIDYLCAQHKETFKDSKVFDDFVSRTRFSISNNIFDGDEEINLNYDRNVNFSKASKVELSISEDIALEMAAFYLRKKTSFVYMDEKYFNIANSHGNKSWNVLNHLGISGERKGLLIHSNIDDEIAKASGVLKNTLMKIKDKGL